MFYAFEDDAAVIFADLHEDGHYLYPGTGAADEIGRGAAVGTKLNVPLPPGSDAEVFAAVWPRVVAHLERFAPEFIILQCGADSLEGDPITHLRFTPQVHGRAARELARSPTGWGTAVCWRSVAAATTAATWPTPGPRWWRTCSSGPALPRQLARAAAGSIR